VIIKQKFFYAFLASCASAAFSAPYAVAAEPPKDSTAASTAASPAAAPAADSSAEKTDDESKSKKDKPKEKPHKAKSDSKKHDKDKAEPEPPKAESKSEEKPAPENKGPDLDAAEKSGGQPAGILPPVDPNAPAPAADAAPDPYLESRKTFSDACRRICKLLREGNYPSALYLSRHTADDLAEKKVNGSDPFPNRSAHLLQILKDCGADTEALDKAFQNEANTAQAKGDNPTAQTYFFLSDQLENGGSPTAPVPVKVVANNDQSEEAIRQEMKLLQAVVKKYGHEHSGKYPTALDATFKKYFANITIDGVKVARPFTNPFTRKPEWFEVKPVEDLGQISAMNSIPKGKVWYCPLTNGNDYAIIAGDHIEHQLRDTDSTHPLIMSKYNVEDKTIKVPDVVTAGAAKPKK